MDNRTLFYGRGNWGDLALLGIAGILVFATMIGGMGFGLGESLFIPWVLLGVFAVVWKVVGKPASWGTVLLLLAVAAMAGWALVAAWRTAG